MEPAAGITVNENPSSNSDPLHQHQQQQQTSNNDETHVITMSAKQNQPQLQQQQQPQAVSIYCIYSANPTELVPNSTRWFKDGQLLHLGSGISLQATGGAQANLAPEALAGETDSQQDLASSIATSEHEQQQQHLTETLTPTGYPVLTIHRVSRRDAGLYECQLANSVGLSERLPASEACRLEVNFRPKVQLRLFRPTKQLRSAATYTAADFSMADLTEIDLEQELLLTGSSLVLSCEVLESKPNKIHKFHWFKGPMVRKSLLNRRSFQAGEQFAGSGSTSSTSQTTTMNGDTFGKQQQQQLMGVTESGQFVLQSLAANFTPQSFSCSAFNSLGASERSQPMDIQLSYTPGKFVLYLTIRSVCEMEKFHV